MELDNYEANLADIALQEQTFYETKPTLFELQMASQLMSNNQNGGHCGQMTPGGFPLLTPIINYGGKGKKKKSVKFLTYVQVRIFLLSSTKLPKCLRIQIVGLNFIIPRQPSSATGRINRDSLLD